MKNLLKCSLTAIAMSLFFNSCGYFEKKDKTSANDSLKIDSQSIDTVQIDSTTVDSTTIKADTAR